jgi:uncharacterized protein (DUF2141 family)
MYRSAILIYFWSLLLLSCAQVGTITGGKNDTVAPIPVKSNLSNGQTGVNETSFYFTFDEFVQLNNPATNISLMPEDAKITAKLSKKTLTLNLSNELNPNTTYLLYLNAAVKDVSEGNDSLMTYAFSTGSNLDSATVSFKIMDVLSGQNLKNYVVGLYDSLNSPKPRYYGRTLDNGSFTFKYLKNGTYFAQCFEDKDKDLLMQQAEPQGINFEPFTPNGDTLTLLVSTPKETPKLSNATILPPGIIGMRFPESLPLDSLQLNEAWLTPDQIRRWNKDSIIVKLDGTKSEHQLIFRKDTFQLFLTERQKNQMPKGQISTSETPRISNFSILYNELITQVDSSKIQVIQSDDSLNVSFDYRIDFHELNIQLNNPSTKEINVQMADSALLFGGGKWSEKANYKTTVLTPKDVGNLLIETDSIPENYLLAIYRNNREIKVLPVDKTMTLTDLLPGDYTFKWIVDTNKNGQWDPLNKEFGRQAEEIIPITKTTKIRANWDTTVSLAIDN